MSDHERESDLDFSRRDALKIAVGVGAAAMIPLVPADVAEAAQKATARPGTLKFFTPAQYKAVDALTEIIIPADDRSPGAKGAKVAAFLDVELSGSAADAKQAWRDGLAALDAASTAQFGAPFAGATAEQQLAIVTEAAKNEANPTTPLEKFFREAKDRTVFGYYTSEIGIHQELKYKGNQFLQEFVGCDHPEHMA
jgi:Gluconate 2-dehydrogenase subunit 3